MSDPCRFVVLVVLYGVGAAESPTLRSLRRCASALRSARLVLWDNSPARMASEEDVAGLRRLFAAVEYVHTPENLPLSRLYNEVIRTRLEGARREFLVVLDHDSEFDESLFSRAAEAISSHPEIPLFLPIVRYGGRTVSPANLVLFLGWHSRRVAPGVLPSRFRTAINSGMIVSARFLRGRHPGYDERLGFYATDDQFMRAYARLEPHLVVLDARLDHRLDMHEPQDVETRLRRFRDLKRGVRILNGGNLPLRLATGAYLAILSARFAVRYRDRRFLR